MKIIRKLWRPAMTMAIAGFPKVSFYGRESFSAASVEHKKALLQCGVFAENPDGTLYYCAKVGYPYEDGTKAYVGQDGWVEYDRDRLDPKKFGRR